MSDHKSKSISTKSMWKDQPMQAQSFTPEMLARNARGLDRAITRRNMIEYVAGGSAILAFGVIAGLLLASGITQAADWTVFVGLVVMMVGTGTVLFQVHRRTGAPESAPRGEATIPSIRAELVRQRDALRKVWLWYLLPFAPGIVIIYLADFLRPDPNVVFTLGGLILNLAVALLLCWLNLRAAQRMDDEIKRIDGDLER